MLAPAAPRRPPRLLAISDRRLLPDGDLVGWALRLARAGVEALQVREKDLSDHDALRLVGELRHHLPPPFLLLVNARPDLAAAAGLDGVHLPASGLPTAEVRRRFGSQLVIGRSVHSAAEAVTSRATGADYVLLGPIYATPAKAPYGPALGAEVLARAARLAAPVLAVGGVTMDRLPELGAAGAAGAAGIREFLQEDRVAALVARARQCFPR